LIRVRVANAEERLVAVRLRLDVRYLPPQKDRIGGKKTAR
jgi:hypothetical protein